MPITALMHHDSDTLTISLERPRKLILAFLYVVLCIACLVGSLALADVGLLLLSKYG